MPNIIFICTANQCRSPMAAALFLRHLDRLKLSTQVSWQVSSAGVWTRERQRAIPTAIKVMQEMGLWIEQHRSRQVTGEMLQTCDLILVMNQHQQEALQVEFAPLAKRIFVLSELTGPKYDIPDPAGGDIEDVREIALEIDQLLKQAMPCILGKLGVQLHQIHDDHTNSPHRRSV